MTKDEAIAKVLEGFEVGVFQRNVDGDGSPGWAVKVLPYIGALALLASGLAMEADVAAPLPAPEAPPRTGEHA
jgi:hypothetical protein